MDYPDSICSYFLDRLHPVFFLIDDQGTILSWGGELAYYPIPTPQSGMHVGDLFFFVEGLLPIDDDPLVLECVQWRDDIVVDVHLFRDARQLWLLLTDAGQKVQSQRRVQQQINEMYLRCDLHPIRRDQQWVKDAARRLADIDAQHGARACTLSILFADIRHFTSFGEHLPPADVVETLNAYLTAMIEPVIDHAGIVDKIVGDAVMAVFGLLPSECTPAVLSVAAAKAIIDKSRAEAENRRQAGKPPLAVGVGIATGPVILGMIGSKDRKTLGVTGHPVNLAACLERQAAGEEILIDRATRQALPMDRFGFTARRLTLRGMDRPITAYGMTGR